MPSFQVDGNCYSDIAAVQAMAAREVGRVVVLGTQTYVIDVDAVSATTITYRLTDLASTSSISKVVNVTPQPCGLLDTSDGLIIGWSIAAAWLATAAVLFIRRGVHT